MTLPLPWVIVDQQTGELAETQAAYRMLMIADQLVRAGRIAQDTFTRPNSSSLDSAETGQVWEILAGAFTVAAQKAQATSSSTAVINVGITDVDAECTIVITSGSPSLVVRCGATDADRLVLTLDSAAGVRLQKNDSGTLTPLQSSVQTFTAGQAYRVRVVADGDSVKGYLDGELRIDYTLTGGDSTKFGAGTAFTRCGFRATGVTAFDDLIVRLGYPASGGGSSPTLANIPAGSVLYAVESAGAYIRPTARSDVSVIFQGTVNPSAVALENDIWAQTP